MRTAQTRPESISRPALIALLRDELRGRAKDEVSICRLAAETGVFCKGFRRFTDDELKERFPWIVRKNPDAPRAELEAIADRWQMARQDVVGGMTSCDVQQLEHDSCGGWDDFTDDQLSLFALELTGRNVEVIR